MESDGSALSSVEPPEPSSDAPPGNHGPLDVLRYSGFRLLWAGSICSNGAQEMQTVISSWLVYTLTESPFQLGLIGIFQAVPLILFSLAGGATADRVDRKKLLVLTQALRIIPAAVLLTLSITGALNMWILYAMTALGSAASVFDRPARQAMLPALVPRELVTNAVTFNTMTFQLNRVVGPSMAGVFLATAGPETAYGANALLFLIAWLAVVGLPKLPLHPPAGDTNMLTMMVEGLTFVTRSSLILSLLVLDAFATFFSAFRALMPIFAVEVLQVGPDGMGLLLSAPALGAVAGSGLVMFFGAVRRKGAIVLVAVFLYSLSILGFGLSPWFWLSLLLAFLMGGLDAIAATVRNSVILLISPDELRGRVESIRLVFVMGAPALGGVQAGAMASLLGAPITLALQALVVTAAVFGVHWKAPKIWELEI